MRSVGRDDPEAFDFAGANALENFVVGPTVARGDAFDGNVESARDFFAMVGAREIVAADEVGVVAEKARAHRVALAGDGVGASSRAANVSGHQCEVNQGLGETGAFVTLIDAHGPP